MPVPTLLTDLSATIASNSPAGSDNVFPDLDNYLRALSGFLASIRDNSGNGWVSPYATAANPSYTGTLTGGTGIVNLGSGQFYKDASGNVGIGTASPGFQLDIQGTGGNPFAVTRFTATAAAAPSLSLQRSRGATVGSNVIVQANDRLGALAFIGANGTSFDVAAQINAEVDGAPGATADMPGRLVFLTSADGSATPTERLRIDSVGNLLVGTQAALTVGGIVGSHAFSNAASNLWTGVFRSTTATTPWGVTVAYTGASPNSTASEFLYCVDSTTIRAGIRSNGGIANFSANDVNLSDVRTKTAIEPAGSYLAKICAIPVKTFLYKDQTDTELNLGVLAQDVDAVAPELIDHSGFGTPPEGESPLLAVYQTDLQFALMKCIQEQQALITALTARVAALEA